jgi:hypothetical protein
MRVTLASIGDAVITTGVDGRVTYMNTVAQSRRDGATRRPRASRWRPCSGSSRRTTGASMESPAVRALRVDTAVGSPITVAPRGARTEASTSRAQARDAGFDGYLVKPVACLALQELLADGAETVRQAREG